MAHLTVAGTAIQTAEVSEDATPVGGDRMRMLDGTLRETVRGYVREWTGSTVPLASSDAQAVWDLLASSSQPQTIGGTMVSTSGGTISGFTRPVRRNYDLAGWVVVEWAIDEST